MTSPFKDNPDGSREFTCTSCGFDIHQAVPDFDFPVCAICRWFDERPQIPKEHKNFALYGQPMVPANSLRAYAVMPTLHSEIAQHNLRRRPGSFHRTMRPEADVLRPRPNGRPHPGMWAVNPRGSFIPTWEQSRLHRLRQTRATPGKRKLVMGLVER